MKRNYFIGLTLTVMVGVLTLGILPVQAHETGEEHAHATDVDVASQQKQRSDRIAQHKAELKTKLTTAQQKRVQARCKNAQTQLKVVTEKAVKVQANRDRIHSNLLARLTALETKLAAGGVDTTDFKAQIANLQTKIDTFKTDSAAYVQAAQDAAELDCQADPVAFKASLEAARTSLKKLQADAVAIRTTFAQEIKPRLAAVKAELEVKKEAN